MYSSAPLIFPFLVGTARLTPGLKPFINWYFLRAGADSELAMPALAVHGRRDPFFPVGNGQALAREIPGARLLVLERAATAIPDTVADQVATAMLDL
jgi:pimeloyl-ACP methyl ester carboxylesterase